MTLQIMGTRLGSKNNGEERKSERFERKKKRTQWEIIHRRKGDEWVKILSVPWPVRLKEWQTQNR